MASDYISNMESQSVKRFNIHQREQQLDKMVEQYGGIAEVRRSVALSVEDNNYLNRLEQEQMLQDAHNAAFLAVLAGFTGKGR